MNPEDCARERADDVQAEEMLRQIFDASPSAMILVGGDGLIRLANVQAGRLFGYENGGLSGLSVEALVPQRFRAGHSGHRATYFGDPVVRAMGEGRDLFGLRHDGTEVPIEIGLNPIRTAAGLDVLAAIIDITPRKRSEDMLRASLREKETLLREIHHRVKNNMQVVSSLLNLQTDNVVDERYRALFEECQTRVRTMALIHEKLYSTGNLASLDAVEYVRELLQMLTRSYLPVRTDVRLALHAEPVTLDLHVAIPFGLILHELVTNAMKHAFQGRTGGNLQVELRALPDDRLRLVVADDGPGLAADFDTAKVRSLGFRMVRGFVRQLDGDLTVSSGPGARFAVECGRGAPRSVSADEQPVPTKD